MNTDVFYGFNLNQVLNPYDKKVQGKSSGDFKNREKKPCP